MSDPFERRTRRCQDRLEQADAEAVVLFPSPNLTYTTGIDESPSERHFLLVIPRAGEPAILAPTLAKRDLEAIWIENVHLCDDEEDPVAVVDTVLEELTAANGKLLVDDRLWATFLLELQSIRPEATFGRASTVFEGLRIRKDAVELEALRRAGALADRVSTEIRRRGPAVVGTTERELADEIDQLLKAGGGLGPAFETIVAAGDHAGRPHHQPTDRKIAAGEPVVLDFGAFVEANHDTSHALYPGDQTRTIVFEGAPSEAYQTVHDTVRRAQQTAVEAVEPGVTAGEIDRVARSVIEEAGYGDAFVHRTGHGVGLEVHEPPYLVAGNERELESGMVFSVEPGIYLDSFGVRLEDLVVVTEDGCERLNQSPLTWQTG